jgi:hypothetical protein
MAAWKQSLVFDAANPNLQKLFVLETSLWGNETRDVANVFATITSWFTTG